MTLCIDLNADLGEDESPEGIKRDLAMMPIVSSCNIACGGHAGSPENMRRMLSTAHEEGTAAGAHPSYPDRDNFGRRVMDITSDRLAEALDQQMLAICEAAEDLTIPLHHLKPHGALYNEAQDDEELAKLLIALARQFELKLVGMAGSLLHQKADEAGTPFIAEAFIDRRYDQHGRLVSRCKTGAVIADEQDRLEQGLAIAKGEPFRTKGNAYIVVPTQSLCLHSDSEGSLQTARSFRIALEQSGILIKASGT